MRELFYDADGTQPGIQESLLNRDNEIQAADVTMSK